MNRWSPSRSTRWWGRRLVVAVVVVLQAWAVVAAYGSPHKVFGWQMFNASSDWRADIVRVERDGSRHDVREPWPGGYEWSELMRGRGFESPFHRQHAHSGLDRTFDLFQSALDWAARNTPDDASTAYLEAVVTYWDNGRGPDERRFVSTERDGPAP